MLRADLIQVFKIAKNLDCVNKDNFFLLLLQPYSNYLVERLKLYKSRFHLDIGKFVFLQIRCVKIGILYRRILLVLHH